MRTSTDTARQANSEQAALWNDSSGRAWIDTQELLDELFRPFEKLLTDAVAAKSPVSVLDVGCGTGAVSLAIQQLLGARGRSVGIDISAPMIAAARDRAARAGAAAEFIAGDAQTHAFEPASFDLIVSRFGVMFFDDSVAAFRNLRRAAKKHAELRLLAWRGPQENPFMVTAEHAAKPLLPQLPTRDPDAPGQFAFAGRDRVAGILADSGWSDIDIQPVDVDCRFPAHELQRYFSQLGPLARFLRGADEATRTRIIDAVRKAFDAYVHADEVRFTAACWMIAARAGTQGIGK